MNAAEQAYAAMKMQKEPNSVLPQRIALMLAGIMDLCVIHELNFAELAAEARSSMDERQSRPRERYTGWDRIHDENKAQGRPIGDQWPHRRAGA